MGPVILAIESSCDETSASLVVNGKVLNNIIATQAIHQKYGGVVPELPRAHISKISSLQCRKRWKKSGYQAKTDLDAIAFTRGPGFWVLF